MARLIRTEKEVEGRYEEVWIVVEEDALDQWPAGPARGRRPAGAARRRARARARRGALHADLALPGMLHTAVLRSARTPTRASRGSTSRRALAAPGVRAAIGPGDIERAHATSPATRARPSRRSRPTRAPRRDAAVDADRRRVGGARAAARPRRGRRARLLLSESAPLRARRRRARARRGGRRRRGRVPHADRAPQLAGDAPGVCQLARRDAPRLHLDAVHLGRPRERRGALGLPAGPRARRLRVHGRRLRLEERRRRLHADRGRARDAAPAGPSAARSRAARRTSSRATATRRSSGCVAGARADGTLTALGGDFRQRGRLERLGRAHRGPDADALRVPRTCARRARREAEHAADGGVPRAGLRRGHVRRSSACSTSSPRSSTSTRSSSAAATTPTPTRSTRGRSRRST